MSGWKHIVFPVLIIGLCVASGAGQSIARVWNEELLDAIRLDYPAPTVHSRNLFHLSAAMYDAWRAYGTGPELSYFVDERHVSNDPETAMAEAISYAAYRILSERYIHSPGAETSLAAFHARMLGLGYDPSINTLEGDSPAALGNRIADAYLNHYLLDGSNEINDYVDNTGYEPVNPPMVLSYPGTNIVYPNFWQPLAFEHLVLQNGIVVGASTQEFLGSHWGNVWPFSIRKETQYNLYLDPGPPPLLNGAGDAAFREALVEVIAFSSILDPDDGVLIDISPGAIGNNPLGTNDGSGYAVNPYTGMPYQPNIVRRGDYGRILAEFWADGPDSETPPGHWNTLANYVSDHPLVEKHLQGIGSVIDDLEWDVKLYFALNGALHDAAIAAWDCKEAYDYVRPISAIRYMAGMGQSSDPNWISYHPEGLPLIPGLIEVINFDNMGPGQPLEHLSNYYGDIAIHAWNGEPGDPESSYSGTGWIRAVEWFPYQRSTFVTPPFAGYVSGHSTFSRAGAEVLAAFTGDPYFPGGLGIFTAPKNDYLEFEIGPTETVTLEWATYYDAADEAGISRLYGGIHVTADDLQGRKMGAAIGKQAFSQANAYFQGLVITTHPQSKYLEPGSSTSISVVAKGSDLNYQWYRNGEILQGERAPILNIAAVHELDYYQVEVTSGEQSIRSSSCHVSPTIFHNDLNLGGGNRKSPWLGIFNDLNFPYIDHGGLGVLYCAFPDTQGGYFNAPGFGWAWTSSLCYPYMYMVKDQRWVFYATQTSAPPWFFSLKEQDWQSF